MNHGPDDTASSVIRAGAGNMIGYMSLVSGSFLARISAIVDLDGHKAVRPAEVALVQRTRI